MKKVTVVNRRNLKKTHKQLHEPYEYYKQEITSRSNYDQCYAAFYEIPPLKSSYPFHYHEENTELFYILSGKGLLRTVDGEIPVSAGDVILCPPGAGGGHKLTNVSHREPLCYLDVDTIRSPDTVHYPDSGKVRIIRHNESSTFYKDGKETDYYDGE